MTVHADELISQQRDEPLGPAEDLFVRHHVAECQECRAFAREVESADRLLRGREPYIAVAPLRFPRADGLDRRPAFAAVAVLFLVLGVVVGTTLGALRTDDQEVGSAGPVPLGASLSGVRAGVPWSVALGDSPAAVLTALGEPERRVDQDRQWVYADSVVVFFDAPASSGGSVWRIIALPGSGASTAEGFEIRPPGGFERFHEIYSDDEVVETYPAGVPPPTASSAARPYVILTVTGRDRAGEEMTISASVRSAADPEVLQIFRGRPQDGRAPVGAGPVPDPVAISACEVVVRAAVIAGYERPGHATNAGPVLGFHCNYAPYRTGLPSADLDLLPRPVGLAEIQDFLVALHPRAAGSRPELGFTWPASAAAAYGDWQSLGPGQWLISPIESAEGDRFRPYAVVHAEPYFVVINDNGSERDEETVKRFAAAVRQVLLDVR